MDLNSLEEINKVLDFNFKNSLKLSTLEVSCPKCYKLYSINPHEIMTTKPQFNCRVCSTQFHINYPECLEEYRIIGKINKRKASTVEAGVAAFTPQSSPIIAPLSKMNSEETPVSKVLSADSTSAFAPVINCPKCNYINSATSTECIKCSVILSKANSDRVHKPTVYASSELKDLWELVLDNYDSEPSHQNFIRYSALEQNLEFASQKYNLILSVNPYDEIANKMKTQIHGLITVEATRPTVSKPAKRLFSLFNLWTLSFILSFSIIGFGVYFNQHKNLIGIGAFSLSLIAGLKLLQSKYK